MEIYIVNDVLMVDGLFAFQVAAVFYKESSLIEYLENKNEFIRIEIYDALTGKFVRFYPGGDYGYFNAPLYASKILKGV